MSNELNENLKKVIDGYSKTYHETKLTLQRSLDSLNCRLDSLEESYNAVPKPLSQDFFEAFKQNLDVIKEVCDEAEDVLGSAFPESLLLYQVVKVRCTDFRSVLETNF